MRVEERADGSLWIEDHGWWLPFSPESGAALVRLLASRADVRAELTAGQLPAPWGGLLGTIEGFPSANEGKP